MFAVTIMEKKKKKTMTHFDNQNSTAIHSSASVTQNSYDAYPWLLYIKRVKRVTLTHTGKQKT